MPSGCQDALDAASSSARAHGRVSSIRVDSAEPVPPRGRGDQLLKGLTAALPGAHHPRARTPEGVIQGKPKDQRVWLKAGDAVACSLEKLGELRFALT